MAGASTLDPDNMPAGTGVTDGSSTGVLGPSDTTDTGSDVSSGQALDPAVLGSDSDASGTGEDAGAPGRAGGGDLQADIGFDRVVGRDEAGLGGGLDQAEEAQLGRLDEDGAADELVGDDRDPVLAGDADADTAADLDTDGLAGSDDTDDAGDDAAGPARRAGSVHGNADDDEDEDADEADDEADENEGEPANPAREAPGIGQDERAQLGPSPR